MKTPTLPTKSRAGLAEDLRISIARLSRRLRAQNGSRLSVTQYAALVAVDRHGSMTPHALAASEQMRPPSMTRVVAVLVEQGLLARAPHPTDGRQVILTVTAEGQKLIRETRRRKQAWLAQRLGELTTEERSVLRRAAPILEKLSQT